MTQDRTSVLIIGGYGTFGGRLAKLLADEERLLLVIAGRSQPKAALFCRQLNAGAATRPVAFDRNGDVAAQLTAIEPHIVVDAAGPFQYYGSDPYKIVEAAIRLGIDYLDLADAADFVDGVARFDVVAKQHDVYALSGVSSFPVLTAAVVRDLAKGMARVQSIAAGIAPSPYAGVGLNVIRAIASYAGRPLRVVRDGSESTDYALTNGWRYTISPPGRLPLRNVRFSLVDVPDLQILPRSWPGLLSIRMGAGPVPEILHRALNAFAWLVRLRLLPSLTRYAKIFYWVINVVRWGEHRGGVYVAVGGVDENGKTVGRSWHLLAEGDDGPLIPSMAVESIIRRSLDGERPAPGSRAATAELEISDYEVLFQHRRIHTGRREDTPSPIRLPLYQELLGDAWEALPKVIRVLHSFGNEQEFAGTAKVDRGRGLLARTVAALFRFPYAAASVPVVVRLTAEDGTETWRRTFGGRSFESLQFEGSGRSTRLLCERFGPFTFGLALVIDGHRLRLVVRRWQFLGVPLPAVLAPGGDSFEHVDNGRFAFHVEISLPIIGLIVRYQGWLEPKNAGAAG